MDPKGRAVSDLQCAIDFFMGCSGLYFSTNNLFLPLLMITLGIDASNITSGGGLTHLVQVLAVAKPAESNLKSIHIWASTTTAQKLPRHDWLVLHTPPWCDGGLVTRIWGQQFCLPAMFKHAACDVLFSPGGTLPIWCSAPMVTMSQNMLPFEPDQSLLFGRISWMRLKMFLLRISQGRSFLRAQGLIFLTQYAYDKIKAGLGDFSGATAVIAHGIEPRFFMQPRPKEPARCSSQNHPFHLLYVSIQMPYKHQLEVMDAVSHLRHQGRAVVLQIVGGSTGAYGDAVRRRRLSLDPDQLFLHDLGHLDFGILHELYKKADAFVFASSCENLPNILIEAMASGLPIACSNRGPMLEALGNAGVYFDPESPSSIEQAIVQLADDPDLRVKLAQRAWQRAQAYSWERCARETLDFVAQVAQQHTS